MTFRGQLLNGHVVGTMQLADALVKSNKDFDCAHCFQPGSPRRWLVRRRWDYFVRNPLGVTPPSDFEVHEDRESAPGGPR